MITTCNKCKWGKYSPCTTKTDRHFGEVFYFCEATRYLIREDSALDEDKCCENFLPVNATCENCDQSETCPIKNSIERKICYKWCLR